MRLRAYINACMCVCSCAFVFCGCACAHVSLRFSACVLVELTFHLYSSQGLAPKVSLDDAKQQRKWGKRAIGRLTGELTRAGETPLTRLFLSGRLREAGISLYVKDESAQVFNICKYCIHIHSHTRTRLFPSGWLRGRYIVTVRYMLRMKVRR